MANFNLSDRLGGPTESSMPIRIYTANGPISDENQIAVIDGAATAMTMPASVAGRRVEFIRKAGVSVIITANGSEQWQSGAGVSTDNQLALNAPHGRSIAVAKGAAAGWDVYN